MTHYYLWVVPLFFAITMHEAAHARAALAFGDGTAWLKGRATLNPFKHFELVGTVLVPALTIWLVGLPFGWAKPVPVMFGIMPRYGRALVALAGPVCNLAQALAWWLLALACVLWLGLLPRSNAFASMCVWGVVLNVVFAAVNMLPLLPLDGGRVIHSLLPPRYGKWMEHWASPWLATTVLVWLVTALNRGWLGLDYILPV